MARKDETKAEAELLFRKMIQEATKIEEAIKDALERIEQPTIQTTLQQQVEPLRKNLLHMRGWVRAQMQQVHRPKRGGGLTPAGDSQVLQQAAAATPPVARSMAKFLDAITAIRQNPDDVDDVAYMARQLVQYTLPHSNPGDVEIWTRYGATGSLAIQSGFDPDTGKKIGLPYGSIPRLLLYWITTEVQLTKNRTDLTSRQKRTLQLGSNLADFMRDVGLNPGTGGGKRSDAKRLHDQMDRLFASRIGWIEKDQTGSIQRTDRGTIEISPRYTLFWDPKRPGQGTLEPSSVLLGELFYEALCFGMPLDRRALNALRRSPLALDLYAWVCAKVYPIVKKGLPPQAVRWSALSRQFGADYASPKNFQQKAQAALRMIVQAYPGLTIESIQGGLTVHATRLAVPEATAQASFPR